MKELFSNDENVTQLDETYAREYSDITIKEKYEKYPKIKYPMITIEEITNEDNNRYFDDSGENVSYLAYQIELNCEQDNKRTAIGNVKRLANIVDKYMKTDKYRCLHRIGGLSKAPLPTDNNVMVGYLRYECNLDVKNNTIYRRY